MLLWFYSTSFKRQVLIGNVVISLLTAVSVVVVGFYEKQIYESFEAILSPAGRRLIQIIGIYALFAFLLSMIREIVKDMEDMIGDSKDGCRTLPIVWGVKKTKNFTMVLILMLELLLLILMGVTFAREWYAAVAYVGLFVVFPLAWFIQRPLAKAYQPEHYHSISTWIKIVMLTGILSMVFLKSCKMQSRKPVILASQSPRRAQLLEQAGIPFEVKVSAADESWPAGMPVAEVPEHIARQKAKAVQAHYSAEEIIVAADTIVVLDGDVIGKPTDREDALRILGRLSGRVHTVITGVVIVKNGEEQAFSQTTEVHFKTLSPEQIAYYVDNYQPYDKAGAYAIQEWIGAVGIEGIHGDFYNVMGLPISQVAERLERL